MSFTSSQTWYSWNSVDLSQSCHLLLVEENHAQDKNVSPAYRISAIDIPGDLNFAGEPVPQDDPEIMERVDREFLVNTYWQSNALLLMKRAHKYFPVIEPILAKNGVPDDFKYLAVAESGLENVVSPAGATGFWQIMKATGREYGLEINDNVDERYHLEKSTEVACRYLKRYRDKYGSWTMAASNSIPIRSSVRSGQWRSGARTTCSQAPMAAGIAGRSSAR